MGDYRIVSDVKRDRYNTESVKDFFIRRDFRNIVAELEKKNNDGENIIINKALAYQGLKLEQYLKMLNKTEEEFRKEYEPQAIEAIKSRLALEAIIKNEKIEATDEEVKAKIKEMAENYGKKAEDLEKNNNIKEYIKQGIENEKAINFLVENSKVKKATTKKETKKAE